LAGLEVIDQELRRGKGHLPMIEAGYWTDDQSIFPNDGRLALNGEAEGDVSGVSASGLPGEQPALDLISEA
jgi:hypothetical protein